MHGDGGAFNKQDGLFTFSWNSLLSTGTTCQTKLVFTVVRKSEMVADTYHGYHYENIRVVLQRLALG